MFDSFEIGGWTCEVGTTIMVAEKVQLNNISEYCPIWYISFLTEPYFRVKMQNCNFKLNFERTCL